MDTINRILLIYKIEIQIAVICTHHNYECNHDHRISPETLANFEKIQKSDDSNQIGIRSLDGKIKSI